MNAMRFRLVESSIVMQNSRALPKPRAKRKAQIEVMLTAFCPQADFSDPKKCLEASSPETKSAFQEAFKKSLSGHKQEKFKENNNTQGVK